MDLKSVSKMAMSFILKSGALNPILQSMSEVSEKFLSKLDGLVNDVKVIWRHKRAVGESKEENFGDFFTAYFNGVVADAVDQNHVDAPAVIGAAINVLVGMAGSTSKYWNESLRDLDGFTRTPIGTQFGDLSAVAVEQVRPVVMAALERVRLDLMNAREWESNAKA